MSHAMAISQARARDTLVRAKRRLMIWMGRIEADDAPNGGVTEQDSEDDPEDDSRTVYYIAPPRKWVPMART